MALASPWAWSQTVVADLARDFGDPVSGANWKYLWNPHGPTGHAFSYSEMKPATIFAQFGDVSYSPDGTADLPSKKMKDANDIYLRKDKGGKFVVGDCGLGPDQGAREERYTIMSYKLAKGGVYSIINSSLKSLVDTKRGNGLDYKVFVNDSLSKEGTIAPMGSATFDASLGILSGGDIIYVEVGPGRAADCTNFSVQFQIASSD